MKIKNLLMVFLIVLLWGSSFPLIKLGLDQTPPITLAFIRFAMASPLLLTYTYFKNQSSFKRSLLQDWKMFILLGLTGVTLPQIFQNVGLQSTSASNSSVIVASNPIWMILFGKFFLSERLTHRKIVGIFFGFFGVIAVIMQEGVMNIMNSASGLGDLITLGSALCWALYSTLGKAYLRSHGARLTTSLSMVFGTFMLIPFMMFTESPIIPSSPISWLYLIILGVFCSGLAYLWWFQILVEEETSKVGLFLFFIPIVSIAVANLLLFEIPRLNFLAGTFLVVLGIMIAEQG